MEGVNVNGITKLSDLRSDELQRCADFNTSMAWIYTRMGEDEIAGRFADRAREFKALTAAEDADQAEYERSGKITLRRRDVMLDDVLRVLQEGLEVAVAEGNGVARLAFTHTIDYLQFVYEEDE